MAAKRRRRGAAERGVVGGRGVSAPAARIMGVITSSGGARSSARRSSSPSRQICGLSFRPTHVSHRVARRRSRLRPLLPCASRARRPKVEAVPLRSEVSRACRRRPQISLRLSQLVMNLHCAAELRAVIAVTSSCSPPQIGSVGKAGDTKHTYFSRHDSIARRLGRTPRARARPDPRGGGGDAPRVFPLRGAAARQCQFRS